MCKKGFEVWSTDGEMHSSSFQAAHALSRQLSPGVEVPLGLCLQQAGPPSHLALTLPSSLYPPLALHFSSLLTGPANGSGQIHPFPSVTHPLPC